MSNERPPSSKRPFGPADLERAPESDLGLEDEKTAPVSAPSARPLVPPPRPSAAQSPQGAPSAPPRQPFEPLGVVPRIFDADLEVEPRIEAAPYVPRGRASASESAAPSEESGVRPQSGVREGPMRPPVTAPVEGPQRGPFGIPERTSDLPPPPVEPFMYLIPGPVAAARAEAARATSRGLPRPVESPRAERARFGPDEAARAVPRVEAVRPGLPADLPPRTEKTPRSGSTTVLQAYFEPTLRTTRSETFEDRARDGERAPGDAPAEHAWLPPYRPHFYYIVASSVAAALAVLVLVSLRSDVRDADATTKSASAPVEVRTNAALPAAPLPSPKPAQPPAVSIPAAAAPVPAPESEEDEASSEAIRAVPAPARFAPAAPAAPARPPGAAPPRSNTEGSSRRPRTLDGVDIETPLISD